MKHQVLKRLTSPPFDMEWLTRVYEYFSCDHPHEQELDPSKLFRVYVYFFIGYQGNGVVAKVVDVDQRWDHDVLEEYILNNSPFVEDVFWTDPLEIFENEIPTKPGMYKFSGVLGIDDAGDWEWISGVFEPAPPVRYEPRLTEGRESIYKRAFHEDMKKILDLEERYMPPPSVPTSLPRDQPLHGDSN